MKTSKEIEEFMNDHPIEENASLLSFTFQRGTFKLAIIREEEGLLMLKPYLRWAYVSEDKKEFITNCYSGGFTGVGASLSSLTSFDKEDYRKYKFVTFYKPLTTEKL